MKQISRPLFAAPLYVVLALLLCFGSCQSSDNARVSEGASVASLPLTAQLGEASSRVSMSDTYGGAFSCSWNSDQLKIYHPYVLNGAVQAVTTNLPFATTTTSGTSATFSYSGGVGYRYNPGARLYAFSSNAGGGYTPTVATDGTTSLAATTLASQKGTLTDCATYDALYGSASVDYSTGLPGSLAMHHLFGMMNLHLTSSTFSTSYPVTVTLTSSAANILPGNSGTATLKADGSLNVLTGSWGTSWSATITPTTAGVVDVYFMTWPFTSITGSLTVSCSDGTGYVYTARTITLSNFGLAAAQVKSKPLALVNAPFTYDSSKLFAWDATDYQPVTLNTVPTNANKTTVSSDPTNSTIHALNACQNCPNYNEISWYLKAGCYWDDGSGTNGGNTTAYKMVDGTTTKVGCWFKKKSLITGFSSTVSSGVKTCTPTALTAALATSQHLSTDYFFLPAAGYVDYTHGGFSVGGISGYYWSSTPYSDTTEAYGLGFVSARAFLSTSYRIYGFSLWQGQ